MEVLFLIVGLGMLWLGSELTIRGALDIAERHKISQLFIGLTILAFGTDLPELFIDVTAALQRLQGIETSDLIVGETIGTTIGQIALALGVASLFGTILITKRELIRDGLTMLGAIVLMFVVSLDGNISSIDGLIFVIVYLLYFVSLFREEKLYEKIKRAPELHLFWAIISVIAGFIMLIIGSNLTVENALLVSERWGIAQQMVGILIVGLGTSLPELATSITAVRRGAGTMAAGNLIGSNIFDILFTIGSSALIAGYSVSSELLWIDMPVLFGISIVILLLFRQGMRFSQRDGFVALALYAAYFIVRAFVLV